jgi:hypothetical protein
MLLYRKYIIITINIVIAFWLFKTVFYPKYSTDFFGLFLFMVLVFWLLYDVYSLLVYKFYFKNESGTLYIEIGFVILILLPIFLLWFFTS